jgi:CRP/FNR family cyclic AMP-dependent transcriptional regulator
MRTTNDTRGSLLGRVVRAQPEDHRTRLNMRYLLESSGVPFRSAQYARRRAIFRQGDPSEYVFHIESGAVLLAVSAHSGQEAICGVLGSGAFLGEEALIGQSVQRQSAIALKATEVLVIAKAHMLRLLHTQPALADRFIEYLLTRKTRLEVDLADQLLYHAEERLAHTLLVLAGCDAWRPCRSMLPDISQEIIAEMVGTTRSRVNAFMGKFKRVGFIEEDDGKLYINTGRLPAVCGDLRPLAGVVSPIVPPAVASEENPLRRAG